MLERYCDRLRPDKQFRYVRVACNVSLKELLTYDRAVDPGGMCPGPLKLLNALEDAAEV